MTILDDIPTWEMQNFGKNWEEIDDAAKHWVEEGERSGPVELDASHAIGHKNTNRHPHRNPLSCL